MNTATLTDMDALLYLLSKGKERMKGNIRTKETCPKCGKPFFHSEGLGYICKDHLTTPTRFYIDLYHGRQIKIYSHDSGLILSSYDLALETQKHIQYEIRSGTFDPSKYIKAEVKKFYIDTLITGFLHIKGVIDGKGELIRGDAETAIAPSYRQHYKRLLELAKDYFKGKDVRKQKKAEISAYERHLRTKFPLWSNKSVKNALDLFKSFLHYVKDDLEYISIVPHFPDIELSEHQFRWVAQKDQIPIFELVPDEDKAYIAFLMLHGCRPSEASALKCSHIDLRTETITISATWSGEVYREKRKGRKSKSVTIPIHPELNEYISERVRGNLPGAFLFVNGRGKHYTESKRYRIWEGVRAKGNLDRSLRLYDFTRHSFASNLINSGTSLFKVSKLLGHSSTKMTEKYTHADVDHLRADLNKLTLKTSPVVALKKKTGSD